MVTRGRHGAFRLEFIHTHGKVMFLQVSVILSTGGAWSGPVWSRRGAWSWGALVRGGCLVETPRTATAEGGTHPTGMDSCYAMTIASTNS